MKRPRLTRREQECTRKVRFASSLKAKLAQVSLELGRNEAGLHVYHCPHCSGWHVGHVPRDESLTKNFLISGAG